MRNFLTIMASSFASIFSSLFVITVVAALFLTTFSRQLFNANLYKNALAEQNIYSRLPEIVGTVLTGTGIPVGGSGMPSFMQILTAADWEAILTILLPSDDLRAMTESTLDQLLAYLNGETDTVTVPLDKLKEHLTGLAGPDLITQLINSQPPCTIQDLAQMAIGTSNGGMVLCKPPAIVLPIVAPLVQELLNSAAAQLPDKITIIKPPSPGSLQPWTGPFGADPITTIRTGRLMMRLSPLLPLVFLVLVTLFGVRSLKSWMRWWGIPIFVSGTIALGLGLLALPALNIAWTLYIVPRIPSFIPADIASIGLELLRSIIHTITEGIILWAIILLAFGLAAWIGSCFIKTKNEPELQVTPPLSVP